MAVTTPAVVCATSVHLLSLVCAHAALQRTRSQCFSSSKRSDGYHPLVQIEDWIVFAARLGPAVTAPAAWSPSSPQFGAGLASASADSDEARGAGQPLAGSRRGAALRARSAPSL